MHKSIIHYLFKTIFKFVKKCFKIWSPKIAVYILRHSYLVAHYYLKVNKPHKTTEQQLFMLQKFA